MYISSLLHQVSSSLANFPTAVLFFLRVLGTTACWNRSMTFPKWVKVSIKMWLSFDSVYTMAITWFLITVSHCDWLQYLDSCYFFSLVKKKKFKTSREWRKVDQRVYFHLSAHSLRVLASRVAEGGHILPKDYFRLCAQVPFCCFHCLLGTSQDVGTNQTERCSLNQDLNELLVALTLLQVIPVIVNCSWIPACRCFQASFKWITFL